MGINQVHFEHDSHRPLSRIVRHESTRQHLLAQRHKRERFVLCGSGPKVIAFSAAAIYFQCEPAATRAPVALLRSFTYRPIAFRYNFTNIKMMLIQNSSRCCQACWPACSTSSPQWHQNEG